MARVIDNTWHYTRRYVNILSSRHVWRVVMKIVLSYSFFFFQAEDGIRDVAVTGVQTCALPISHWLDRDRYDKRHFAPHLLRKSVNGEDRRLDIPGVLAGLDQQQIRSAFNEAFCLRVIGLSQFVERHAAGNRNRLGCWPHGTGYEPRLQRGTEFICRLPRQLGRALV